MKKHQFTSQYAKSTQQGIISFGMEKVHHKSYEKITPFNSGSVFRSVHATLKRYMAEIFSPESNGGVQELPPHRPHGLLSAEHSGKPATSNDGVCLTLLVSGKIRARHSLFKHTQTKNILVFSGSGSRGRFTSRQICLAPSRQNPGKFYTVKNIKKHDCSSYCDQIKSLPFSH